MYNLRQNADILLVLIQKELKAKYKNSFLGFFWSILHPVITSIIYYYAFKIIIKIPTDNYALVLMSGLFLWQWFQVSLLNSVNCYLHNRALVKKLSFDRYLLPMSIVATEMIHLVASIPALLAMMFIFNIPITGKLLFIPIILTEAFILLFALSLVFSILNVIFRDLERIIMVLLQIIFYATPIIYTSDMIPSKYKSLVLLNPFFPIFEFWRSIFLNLNVNLNNLLYSLEGGILCLLLAIIYYKKYIHIIAERL